MTKNKALKSAARLRKELEFLGLRPYTTHEWADFLVLAREGKREEAVARFGEPLVEFLYPAFNNAEYFTSQNLVTAAGAKALARELKNLQESGTIPLPAGNSEESSEHHPAQLPDVEQPDVDGRTQVLPESEPQGAPVTPEDESTGVDGGASAPPEPVLESTPVVEPAVIGESERGSLLPPMLPPQPPVLTTAPEPARAEPAKRLSTMLSGVDRRTFGFGIAAVALILVLAWRPWSGDADTPDPQAEKLDLLEKRLDSLSQPSQPIDLDAMHPTDEFAEQSAEDVNGARDNVASAQTRRKKMAQLLDEAAEELEGQDKDLEEAALKLQRASEDLDLLRQSRGLREEVIADYAARLSALRSKATTPKE